MHAVFARLEDTWACLSELCTEVDNEAIRHEKGEVIDLMRHSMAELADPITHIVLRMGQVIKANKQLHRRLADDIAACNRALLTALQQQNAGAQESLIVQRGLVRARHPNRDFFIADLFDYSLKDDGASMEAPIFTLSTKPDLSTWEWHSKDGNKHVRE